MLLPSLFEDADYRLDVLYGSRKNIDVPSGSAEPNRGIIALGP